MTSLRIMVLTFLAVLFFSAVAAAQVPMTLGWHQLSSTTIRPLCPDGVPGATGCDAITTAWSGAMFDTKRNRLLIAGGGHNDYAGNEVYSLNLGDGTANPTMTRVTDPSASFAQCTSLNSDGQITARHGYNHMAYLPDTDEFFYFGGAEWCSGGGFINDLVTMNLANNTWTQRASPSGMSGDNFGVGCAYDQRNKLVYCHMNAGLYSYNRSGNAWTNRSTTGTFGNYKTAMIDPVRKRYIVAGQDQTTTVRYYDITNATGTPSTSTASTNCAWPGNRGALEYDPVQDVGVAWDGGNSVEIMNLTTFQCSTSTYSGGPTAVAAGTFSRFRYSPRLNLFVVCNDIDANCYALRLTLTRTILPTVDDEKNTYRGWGWTITASTDTFNTTDPIGSYSVSDPAIHADTEADDGWTYHMQLRRSGNSIWQTRATAWLNYLKSGYRSCSGSASQNFCHDRDQFGLDHFYGIGLIDYYEASGDSAALTEINALGDYMLDIMYDPNDTPYSCVPSTGCLQYNARGISRHLLFAARWAELTGSANAIALRNQIVTILTDSSFWNATYGMYFFGEDETDGILGAGSYASGIRITSPWHIGIMAEAFHHVVRTTGNATIKARLIALANFVNTYGLGSNQYAGTRMGVNINTGQAFHSGGPDPAMTTSLVGVLVYGYKYTGTTALLTQAKTFFNRGTKGVYGSTERSCSDTEVCHFQDTVFSTADSNFYLDYNKGEIQYTYRIFENGGSPTVIDEAEPPAAVSGARRRRTS